jgi:hypothetical protein
MAAAKLLAGDCEGERRRRWRVDSRRKRSGFGGKGRSVWYSGDSAARGVGRSGVGVREFMVANFLSQLRTLERQPLRLVGKGREPRKWWCTQRCVQGRCFDFGGWGRE